jgi:hypothetical protein
MKSFAVLLGMVLCLIGSSTAFAALIVDIRAVSGTNGAVVENSKHVGVPAVFDAANPATFSFQIYAFFTTGTGGASGNDAIQHIQGGMQTIRDAVNYGFKGDISPIDFGPLWAEQPGTQPGIPTANSVGDLVIPTTPAASVWSARKSVMQPVDEITLGTFVGTFTVTQTGLGEGYLPTTVNFTTVTSVIQGAGNWIENGKSYNNLSNPKSYMVYTAGAPVTIGVPEPASFILLGMGAISLIAFALRWRKQ